MLTLKKESIHQKVSKLLKACPPSKQKKPIPTPIGLLYPRFSTDSQSRIKESSVQYHKTGEIKSLPLEQPTRIQTSAGKIRAELVTFYKSGKLKRLFPLDGKITGYWTEANEYQLAQSINIPTPVGEINVKPIYIEFHESGLLKSILFWPKERVNIATPFGEVNCRVGISFHESGALKNIEPHEPVTIKTIIGDIEAYNPYPQGIMTEKSSICLNETGDIISLYTINSQVNVLLENGIEKIFSPKLLPSYCDDSSYYLEPLFLEFQKDIIIFKTNNHIIDTVHLSSRFKIKEYSAIKSMTKEKCNY